MIDTPELERRMRPGAWSDEGFLGPDERLEDVLLADRQTLEELELEPGQLADTLEYLLGATVIGLVALGRTLDRETRAAVKAATRATEKRFGSVATLSEDPMTSFPPGVLVGGRYEVRTTFYFGYQQCPWSVSSQKDWCAASDSDWHIRDRQRGLEMRGPELITHLIREHGFFEGFASPYRVDPRALAELLQMGPYTEPTLK